ncbi:hypothetical protein KC640_00565, partial [Candidatus Dojkabacteria bacterium]|nr:hypothetical protein [Candidatus Dojkabacteria bacterium]
NRQQPVEKITTPEFGLGVSLEDMSGLQDQINSLLSASLLTDSFDGLEVLKLMPGLTNIALTNPLIIGADIQFSVRGEPGLNLSLKGKLLRDSGALTYAGQGNLLTGGTDLPISVVISGNDIYLKAGETDRSLLTSSQQLALDFVVGQWVRFDAANYFSGVAQSLNVNLSVPEERRAEIGNLWQETPIFKVESTESLTFADAELNCALAKLNQEAFPGAELSDRSFQLVLCEKSTSELPATITLTETWGSVNGWDLTVQIYQTEAEITEFSLPDNYKELGEIINFIYN